MRKVEKESGLNVEIDGSLLLSIGLGLAFFRAAEDFSMAAVAVFFLYHLAVNAAFKNHRDHFASKFQGILLAAMMGGIWGGGAAVFYRGAQRTVVDGKPAPWFLGEGWPDAATVSGDRWGAIGICLAIVLATLWVYAFRGARAKARLVGSHELVS